MTCNYHCLRCHKEFTSRADLTEVMVHGRRCATYWKNVCWNCARILPKTLFLYYDEIFTIPELEAKGISYPKNPC